jgi:hypothetical protein
MLYVVLVCSDDRCDVAYEGWCEAEELEQLLCEECGCTLEAIAFAEAGESAPEARHIQLRDAA